MESLQRSFTRHGGDHGGARRRYEERRWRYRAGILLTAQSIWVASGMLQVTEVKRVLRRARRHGRHRRRPHGRLADAARTARHHMTLRQSETTRCAAAQTSWITGRGGARRRGQQLSARSSDQWVVICRARWRSMSDFAGVRLRPEPGADSAGARLRPPERAQALVDTGDEVVLTDPDLQRPRPTAAVGWRAQAGAAPAGRGWLDARPRRAAASVRQQAHAHAVAHEPGDAVGRRADAREHHQESVARRRSPMRPTPPAL